MTTMSARQQNLNRYALWQLPLLCLLPLLLVAACGRTSSQEFALPSTRIAFVSNREGNTDIYVMNADGSQQTRLTNNPANDTDPTWSPDGQRIAFVSDRDGIENIYMMNADGTHQVRLTNNPLNTSGDYAPTWSPDGRHIAFVSNRAGRYDIYMMNTDGSHQTRLTNKTAVSIRQRYSYSSTTSTMLNRRRSRTFVTYCRHAPST
jgi:Tol biopolymer transport system component